MQNTMVTSGLKSAIDRRRKIADALALADTLSEQLRMAGLVQRDFLPRQLPDSDSLKWATTFLPAEWVSGDIYYIERVDEKHIGFYVADVVGHGIPAALLTIFLKQALVMRETSGKRYRIFSPAEVMTKLNERMTEQKLSGHQFITCCYCLLNIETLELIYARAGHPYPILIRGQEPPRQLEVQGSLLGIFEKTQYTQETVQLQAGDKLLLYSDGAEPFIGNFDEQAGRFTFSRHFSEIKNLPVGEMVEKFNTIVQNQKPTQPQSETDDITVVAFEII
jgi:sigma-B regulation protein RsbU (phosphoserine phosphatase)